jgi:beta-lactamase class A
MKNFAGLKLLPAVCSVALLTLPALPVMAQDEAPEAVEEDRTALQIKADQVVSVLNGELDPQFVFTDGFLAAVPPAQLAAISQQFRSQFGAAVSVESLDPAEGNRAIIAVRMERAIARGPISIDPADDNRISELLFQSFDPIDDSPAKIEADLAALPGGVSAWFGPLDGGDPAISLNETEQMPLGSTFKLYILAALARDVAEGERAWDDQVTLTTRSFPSGMMQDWPADAPVTLQTLASMMISISDNTATDQLLALLGRDAVLQAVIDSGHSAPQLNAPFLSTREMFLLKGGSDDRLAAYQNADAAMREQVLDGIESEDVPASQIQAAFAAGPIALDVEWFANAPDLANLFRFMRAAADPRAFDIMAINPSMTAATRERWAYAGYKGGSEPGVLNLTWLLSDEAGRDYALVLSWRDDEASLNQTALELIAQRILSLPR